MRGKGQGQGDGCDHQGITPAYAGKSLSVPTHGSRPGDHPRVCGEKDGKDEALDCGTGSPPRMRGKDAGCFVNHEKHRITPACAGKSLSVPTHGSRPGDHPRVCGEKGLDGAPAGSGLGSPPRMRGKALCNAVDSSRRRITPACAGKSPRPAPPTPCRRDHPRMCGEKGNAARRCSSASGSPPRVRGKGHLLLDGTVPLGITPAYAGKSGSCPASPPWSYPPRITVSRPRP